MKIRELLELADAELLTIEPGQVVIVRCGADLDYREYDHLGQSVREFLKAAGYDNKVVILSGYVTLETVWPPGKAPATIGGK